MNSLNISYSSLLLCLALILFSSCTKDTSNELDSEHLTDEQLFRDIVFSEGVEFSEDLPEYSSYLASVDKKGFTFQDFKSFAVNFIQQQDPYFFESFKEAISTKNPYSIKEAFSKSLSLVSISEVMYLSNTSTKERYNRYLNKLDISNVVTLQEVAKEMYLATHSNKDSSISNNVVVVDTDPSFDFALPPPCLITGLVCTYNSQGIENNLNKYQQVNLLNEKMVNAIIKNY